MKKMTIFYLDGCPYCRNARKALAELQQERPEYDAVEVEWVEESKHPEIADLCDYYYVPSAFLDKTRLYEAVPNESYADCKANLRAALNTVCELS